MSYIGIVAVEVLIVGIGVSYALIGSVEEKAHDCVLLKDIKILMFCVSEVCTVFSYAYVDEVCPLVLYINCTTLPILIFHPPGMWSLGFESRALITILFYHTPQHHF